MIENRTTPLVVDLDGTLTRTDTLLESLILLARQSPLRLLRSLLCLLNGRAVMKESVSAEISISYANLPYHEPLLAYLREERDRGRRIVLATAAHKSIANGVAAHLGLFDDVLATDSVRNLKGKVKLEVIQERVGVDFAYAGNSCDDVPVWKGSRAAVLVGTSPNTGKIVRRDVPIEREFPKEKAGIAIWLRALRIHQWLKNLLLFVPLLVDFSFTELEKLEIMAIAFLAFSFAASATYIINDLLDLDNDRAHARKRLRPFASGRIPLVHGAAAGIGALILASVMALAVSIEFFLMVCLYLALTSAYSWVLKEYVLIDVLALSLLYTIRILAGCVAVGIAVSSWLLAFSVFTFLSLALVKRCGELVSLQRHDGDAVRGRDYRISDLTVLWPLGVGAAVAAVVVFGLFISATETQARYATPSLLWLVAVGLIYWLARLWVKTSRGEMHDDPMVYAIKDRGSRITVLSMIAVTLIAHFVTLDTIL